ncbi:MAG: NusG domain II-containing protein [Clostridiales bacterium]|nr:NusG domain II-containing protein [Clostridiales bacterium]
MEKQDRLSRRISKKELLFITGILALAAILWLWFRFSSGEDCAYIRITVDGEELGVYSLAEDQMIAIGDTNVCEIRDGEARMIQADCPDQLCMHQDAIDERGGTIICLPNKVVIEGEEAGDPDENEIQIDSVT